MGISVRKIFTFLVNLATAGILSMTLIGCGGSSSKSSPVIPLLPATNTIDGAVVKGIVSDGIVTAYRVIDGVVTSTVLDMATTDVNGDYNLEIPDDYSGIVAIEITASSDAASPSLMTCDAASDCGSFGGALEMDTNSNGRIDFGEQFVLNSDFSMWAFVNTVGGVDISVNITPLTDAAAAYASTLPQGVTALSVDVGNSQVADLFGITGDITTLTPPNLTDATELENASAEELEYALIAAAIGGLATDESNTVADVLNNLAQSFTDNNGQLLLNSDTGIDFGDIVQEAANTATFIASENTALADQLNTLADGYEADAVVADSAETGETTEAEASPTVGEEDLDVVKAFIADVRTWGSLITLEEKNTLNAFAIQLSIAEELLTLDVESMGLVLTVLGDLTMTMEEEGLTTIDLGNYIQGATGTMNYDPDLLTASVGDAVVEGVTVNLEITSISNIAETKIELNISGELENDNAIMIITSGIILADFDAEGVDIDSASLDLGATVSQKTTEVVTDPISFSGDIDIDIIQGVEIVDPSGVAEENLQPTHLGLIGTVSNSSGTNLVVSFIVNISNAETFTPPYEDDNNWVDFDFELSFVLSLPNSPVASISLSGDRTGLDSGEVIIEINYDARSILIDLDSVLETGTVIITNQDSVELVIDISADPQVVDQIVGDVTLSDTIWAEIRFVDGVYLIVYADGTFESLN